MNIAEVESLIMEGLGRIVRAEQLAGPAELICYPHLISEDDRRNIMDARDKLMLACLNARTAAEKFLSASAKLGEYLNG